MILNGLFQQLNLKAVRAAFLQGRIIDDPDAPQVLKALDAINDKLFPRWLPTDEERSTDCDIATLHLGFLLTGSNSVFNYTGGRQKGPELTYASWNKVINKISESPFWFSEEWVRGKCNKEAREINSEDEVINETVGQKERLRKLTSDQNNGVKVKRKLNPGEKYRVADSERRIKMLEESDTDESKVEEEVSSDCSGSIKSREKKSETHCPSEDSNDNKMPRAFKICPEFP